MRSLTASRALGSWWAAAGSEGKAELVTLRPYPDSRDGHISSRHIPRPAAAIPSCPTFMKVGQVGVGAGQSRRRAVAQAVSSWRLESWSLRSTAETCVSTVFTEMKSSAATSLYA